MKEVWKNLGLKPVVVASLGGGERVVDSARRAEKLGADLIEIRIDSLKPKERANIKSILAAIKEVSALPLIATVRSAKEQGPQSQSVQDARERKVLFEDAVPLADCVDVEIESDDVIEEVIALAKNYRKKIILSYHDFAGVPDSKKISALLESFKNHGGDMLKIAGMVKSSDDVLNLFSACKNLDGVHRTFIGMGDLGRLTRVAGFMYGSEMSYGYMNKPTAPGQMSVQELTELFSLFYPSYRPR